MHSIEAEVDLGHLYRDLCDTSLERAEAKALLALLLADQAYFVEQAASLLCDEFETDPWAAHVSCMGGVPAGVNRPKPVFTLQSTRSIWL